MIAHFSTAYGGGLARAVHQYRQTSREPSCVVARSSRFQVERAHDEKISLQPSTRAALQALRQLDDVDVLHLHSSVAGALGRMSFEPRRRLTVYSPHGLANLRPGSKLKRNCFAAVEKSLAVRADRYGAVSTHEADQLLSLGVKRQSIILIPHVMISTEPNPVIRESDLVIMIGRLEEQKDPALAVRIIDACRNDPRLQHLRFVWVGGGDSKHEHGLEAAGAKVTGWISQEQVLEWMARASLLLHTAHFEGMPFVWLEAMASGLPVLVRRTGIESGMPIQAFETISMACSYMKEMLGGSSAMLLGIQQSAERYLADHHTGEHQRAALEELYR